MEVNIERKRGTKRKDKRESNSGKKRKEGEAQMKKLITQIERKTQRRKEKEKG